jgi:hypothetical protein
LQKLNSPVRFRLRLFDNLFIVFFFLFLAFNYALTFRLSFPLKISEIALFLLIGLMLIKTRFRILVLHTPVFKILSFFVVWVFLSMLVNLFWNYPYDLASYESRFGYKFDSILKFIYLTIAFGAFIIASNVFVLTPRKYLNILIFGALIATIYSWHLFLGSLLGFPILLLPGMDEEPQMLAFLDMVIIRSGTFKEGNYMGFFLLFAAIIAFYHNRKLVGYFFLFSILTTVSSMAFICSGIFLSLYIFHTMFNKRRVFVLLLSCIVALAGFAILMQTESFRFFFLSKIISTQDAYQGNEFSRLDRLNSSIIGINIGLENPVFGAGISNYALHFDHFNKNNDFAKNYKSIPNNVYAEILSETGFVGLFLFLWFLWALYRLTSLDKSRILRFGFIASIVYLLAFPTFTILFIWVFFALIAALPKQLSLKEDTKYH